MNFAATDNVLNAKIAVDQLASHLDGRAPVSLIACRDLYQGFMEGLKMYPDLNLVGAPLEVPFAITPLMPPWTFFKPLSIYRGFTCLATKAYSEGTGRELLDRGSEFRWKIRSNEVENGQGW